MPAAQVRHAPAAVQGKSVEITAQCEIQQRNSITGALSRSFMAEKPRQYWTFVAI